MDKLDEVEAEKADNSEEEVNKLCFSSIAIFLGGKNIYFELIYFWFFSFIFVCIFSSSVLSVKATRPQCKHFRALIKLSVAHVLFEQFKPLWRIENFP